MKAFYARLLLFLAPLLLLVGAPVFLIYWSGELMPARRIAQKQKAGPALFGVVYASRERPYKLQSLVQRRPEVIALGTSRVMQIRGAFFKDPSSFYNCGFTTINLWHVRKIMQAVPSNRLPRLIILGVDPWWFNPKLTDERARGSQFNSRQISFEEPEFADVVPSWWKVYRDLAAGKITLAPMMRRERKSDTGEPLGVLAIMEGSGYRSDGSRRYGKQMGAHPEEDERVTPDMFAPLERGELWFGHSLTISEPALGEMRAFLQWCRARQIHVAGYLPPLPPLVHQKMHTIPGYRFMWDLPGRLAPIFSEAGYPLFDLQNGSAFGSSDEEFLDESHGSEVCMARALQVMARRDPILAARLDANKLQTLVARRLTRLDLGLDQAAAPLRSTRRSW